MDDTRDQLAELRLHSQADAQTMWQLLMQPLGFASTSLWACLVDRDRRPTPHLVQISDRERGIPSVGEVSGLFEALGALMAEEEELGGIAFLITRPGSGPLAESDRTLARRLYAAARETGVFCHPIHVAHDLAVVPVAPDDLVA